MSAKTKIVVLHMKELIIVGSLVIFAILLIVLFLSFSGSKDSEQEEVTETMTYAPGVYTSTINLSDSTIEVAVTVDADHINSIELVNLDETIQTMYPLVSSAFNELTEQILSKQSLEGITYSPENQYTTTILYKAIVSAIEKASPE